MRVLFATTAGAGHLGPLVPFAEACRRARWDVLVAAPGSFHQSVERLGFAFWPLGEPTEEAWRAVMAPLPSRSAEDANRIVIAEVFGRLDGGAALPRMLEAIDEWRPDVVVREANEYSSIVAAEKHEVRHIHVAIGVAANDAFAFEAVEPAIEELRTSVGLGPDAGLSAIREAPYFTLTPGSFEDPRDPGPAHASRFRDPAMAVPPPVGPSPDDLPLVYVTLGSVAPTMGFFPVVYRAVLDALADMPIRVLMTVGEAADPVALGPLPANAAVERWVPQAEILPRVAVVVGHGGYGTVLGALAAGRPMVILPLFADQPVNAARVAALGAGVALPGGAAPDPGRAIASVHLLPEAVTRLLSDPTFTQAAGRVAAEIGELPPVDVAVGMLAAP